MYFWSRYGKTDVNRRIAKTSSSEFVSKRFCFIDRFHQSNHRRPICQKDINIGFKHDNEKLKRINTEAAEQKKQCTQTISKCVLIVLRKKIRVRYFFVFHLMNSERNTCNNEFEYSRKYDTKMPYDKSIIVP